jgi:sec-independent protein translocase protein TatA
MQTTILFLNDIGTSEVLFIMAAVLIMFGSKSIPGIAKNLGRGIREVKTATDEIKRDIQDSAMEMKRNMNMPDLDIPSIDIVKEIEAPLKVISNPVKEISKSIINSPNTTSSTKFEPNKLVDETDLNETKS